MFKTEEIDTSVIENHEAFQLLSDNQTDDLRQYDSYTISNLHAHFTEQSFSTELKFSSCLFSYKMYEFQVIESTDCVTASRRLAN